MKVAVVGGGIMGSCTTLSLARRGHTVSCFDMRSPGSSLGRSRIVRQAYPDEFYTQILLKGHQMWTELEEELGEQVYHPVGLLYFGPSNAPDVIATEQSLRSLGVEHSKIGPSDLLLPLLKDDDCGILTPDAGWVAADRVLNGVRKLSENAGATLVHQKVDRDDIIEFDRIVVCAGPWVRDWLNIQVETSLQTYAYIEGTYDGPVWIESGPHMLYGFPTEPGATTFKAGVHTPGTIIDPSEDAREPDDWALEILIDLAQRRFGVADPVVAEAGCCIYTKAANDDFKIAWRDERTLVASPCSGHGFKFGPWMGEFLSDLIEAKQSLADWPRFTP